jgi:hypothetical protein
MKKKLFVVGLSMAMLSALAFGEALAASVSISGTLDLADATVANLAYQAIPGGPCELYPALILWHYDVYSFTVTVDGTYNIGVAQPFVGSNGWAWTDESLYNGPFTPGDPIPHCVDSWGPGTQAFPLVAGHVYTLIVFTYEWNGINSGFGKYNVTISGPGNVVLLPDPDNRINWDSGLAGPVALYCNDDVLDVWLIDLGSGEGIYQFSFDAWDDTAPDTNTLVKSVGATELWHLSTGEYQLNLPYSPEYGVWKGYAFLFNGCPYDGNGYTNNFDPQQ